MFAHVLECDTFAHLHICTSASASDTLHVQLKSVRVTSGRATDCTLICPEGGREGGRVPFTPSQMDISSVTRRGKILLPQVQVSAPFFNPEWLFILLCLCSSRLSFPNFHPRWDASLSPVSQVSAWHSLTDPSSSCKSRTFVAWWAKKAERPLQVNGRLGASVECEIN